MRPRYISLLLFAFLITGLADGVEAGFAGLGASPLATLFGAPIVAVTEPLGIALGLAISCCINITMGAGLLALLAHEGMWGPSYWKYLFPGFVVETIPGLNSLPFWVAVVVLCIIEKTKEEPDTVLGQVARVASAAAAVSTNPATVGGAVKTLEAIKQIRQPQPAAQTPAEAPVPQRVGVDLKNVNAKPQAA